MVYDIILCIVVDVMELIVYLAAGVNVYYIVFFWSIWCYFCNSGPGGSVGVVELLELGDPVELLVLCFGWNCYVLDAFLVAGVAGVDVMDN